MQHGPCVCMFVMHSVCLSPCALLCTNNFEMHVFVLIKNGGRSEKRYRIVCLKLAVLMITMKILYIQKPIIIADNTR